MNQLTLGSLFDGIGGFPLAGIQAGVTPVWASEIEPFPVRVTQKRLPDMKHYGDVSKLNGGDLEPVDVITFGSPCQDLPIAGKRSGLDGARSGLFREATASPTECAVGMQLSNGYPRPAPMQPNIRHTETALLCRVSFLFSRASSGHRARR